MRVSLSVDSLSPRLTGIGRYCWELVRGLSTSEEITATRYFIGNNWFPDPTCLLDPATEGFRGPRWQDKLELWWNHRRHSDHVVHAPNYFLPSWAEQGVVTVHDLSVLKYPETHPAERIKAFEAGFAATIERAGLILTDCEWVRREVMDFTGLGAGRVMAVPLGIAADFRPRGADELQDFCARHQLVPGSYGLCVSTLEPRKRISNLIAAWQLLPPSLRTRYPLVLAGGSGWRNEDLIADITYGEAEGWLRYLGYIDEHDLPLLYAGARVFAYPSQYEGFGFPPLEAMASGVPTIVAKGTCLEETAGPAAVLIDPDDIAYFAERLEQIISDENEHARLASAGVHHAAQYSWTRCIEGTIGAYQTMLQR